LDGKFIVLEGDYLTLDSKQIMELAFRQERLPGTNLLLPDAWLLSDCRRSQSKDNKLFSYLACSRRPAGVETIVMVCPDASKLDKRILREVDLIVK
jgi:hypothetical protein